MNRVTQLIGICGIIVAGAPSITAQAAWDSPLLIAPGSPAGLGVYLVDPSPGELAVLATWRTRPAPVGIGLRGGVGEDEQDDLSVFGGIDISGSIVARTEPSGFDLIWVSGVGVGASDDLRVTVPGSLIFGWSIAGEGLVFRPYVGPTAFLDLSTSDDDPDDSDLGLSVDLGADLEVSSDWTIRIGGTLGDREALAVGVMIPSGR